MLFIAYAKMELVIQHFRRHWDYACGAGADCSPILQNGACYQPNTIKDHCSYAVNSYFQRKGQTAQSCDFSGAASQSQTAPSSMFIPPKSYFLPIFFQFLNMFLIKITNFNFLVIFQPQVRLVFILQVPGRRLSFLFLISLQFSPEFYQYIQMQFPQNLFFDFLVFLCGVDGR